VKEGKGGVGGGGEGGVRRRAGSGERVGMRVEGYRGGKGGGAEKGEGGGLGRMRGGGWGERGRERGRYGNRWRRWGMVE